MNDEDKGQKAEAEARRAARLDGVAQGLMCFVHFVEMASDLAQAATPPHWYWWYNSAAMVQADMLFCGKVAGDLQPGAALRALRDLGRPDLVEALSAVVNKRAYNNRTLGDVFTRMRNEAIVHHSFDFEAQGRALVYLGEPDNESYSQALEELIAVIDKTVDEIHSDHMLITLDSILNGRFLDIFKAIGSSPNRAKETELQRRAKQRLDQRFGEKRETPREAGGDKHS